jgi:hypothetical protein
MVSVDVAIQLYKMVCVYGYYYFVCKIGQPPTTVESRKKVGSNTVTYGFWIDAPVTITS